MHLVKRAAFIITAIILGRFGLYLLMTPGVTLPHNTRMGEWKKADVREACFGALETLKDPELPRYPSDFTTADGVERAREMTAALHCYLVTKRDAVCNPDNRAYIVDYVGKYYDKMDSMMASAKRQGGSQFTMMQRFWDSGRNRQISAAIETAIREGKLSKSDFGWSSPAALKTLLAQYAKAPDQCPTRTADRRS